MWFANFTSIAKKFERGLSEQYDPISFQDIEAIAEEKLRTLSEIEAAENAVTILNTLVKDINFTR